MAHPPRDPDAPREHSAPASGTHRTTTADIEDALLQATTPSDLARTLLHHPRPRAWLTNRRDLPHEPLARALLERSRHSLPRNAAEARHAAALAETVLDAARRLDSPSLPTISALHRANAARADDDLQTAVQILDRHARAIGWCPSHRTRGDLHLLAATIRTDQHRLLDAHRHLTAAMDDYAHLRDPRRNARALIHTASFFHRIGDLDGAIDAADAATRQITPDTAPELYLTARHNLAGYLTEADRPREATTVLTELGPLYPRSAGSPYLIRYRWLCARLAAATGDPRGAAGTYTTIRDRLLSQGRRRDAALVTVDLAHLHLGDTDQLLETLASLRTILPPPAAPEIHRELRAVHHMLRHTLEPSPLHLRRLAHLLQALPARPPTGSG